MVHLLEDCNLCAIHAKRVTISASPRIHCHLHMSPSVSFLPGAPTTPCTCTAGTKPSQVQMDPPVNVMLRVAPSCWRCLNPASCMRSAEGPAAGAADTWASAWGLVPLTCWSSCPCQEQPINGLPAAIGVADCELSANKMFFTEHRGQPAWFGVEIYGRENEPRVNRECCMHDSSQSVLSHVVHCLQSP